MAADVGPLHIDTGLVEVMLTAAAAAVPREACGLLVGRGRHVLRVVPVRNVDPSPARYTVSPEDHFATLRAARQEGLAVIGAYHSHPAGEAAPSPTDAAEAVPDFLYLIVGLVPTPEVTAWEFVDGNFAALSLVRT